MPGWLGIALAPAIAVLGYGAGWLTADGAVAASIIGATVFAGGGIPGATLLVFFFVSGSVLSAFERRTLPRDDARRNGRQVFANGMWAAIGAALLPSRPVTGAAVVVGALAAAQGDTWATEVGTRWGGEPRLITTWERVPSGASGGVTAAGSLGGFAGAALLAGLAILVGFPARAAIAGFAAGLLGIAADSLLGATVQAGAYRSTSGWPWLDNDGVNLIATGTAGLTAALLCSWP